MQDEHDSSQDSHDDMPTSASIATTPIDGKTFVSGLFWQPLTKPRDYKKEAQAIGKREGMDIVTIRRSTIMQAGFAPRGHGAGKGMYSLASALAGKLGNSWIGVFDLGSGHYAFVAVTDGAIVPGCDVIGARDSIEKRIRYFYGSSSWSKVYAPADFDFGGEEVNIQKLLGDASFSKGEWREFQLRPLQFGMTRGEVTRLVAILVGCAILAVGYLQYREYERQKEKHARILAEQARLAEQERLKALTKNGTRVLEVAHPWVQEPATEDLLRGCGAAIDGHLLSIGGWQFETATCDGKATVATYRRAAPATMSSFSDAIAQDPEAVHQISPDQEVAHVTRKVALLLGGDDALVPAGEALADYGSFFQAAGLKVRFVEQVAVVAKPAVLPGAQQPAELAPPPVPPWKTYVFEFNTDRTPHSVFSGRSWGGMRLSSFGVKLNPDTANLTWSISGKIYAK